MHLHSIDKDKFSSVPADRLPLAVRIIAWQQMNTKKQQQIHGKRPIECDTLRLLMPSHIKRYDKNQEKKTEFQSALELVIEDRDSLFFFVPGL